VADPAAGSYYIENLTSLIAENAWKLFLEIEDQGGFLSCLKSGLIQRKLSESSSVRKSDIASGKEVLLGTNRFPDFTEKAPSEIDLTRVFKSPIFESDLQIEPIKLFRGSEEHERLRLESREEGNKINQ
jgi:methylmalonyl-CoA mutase